ncbi:MAG: AMP-binding protein [Myxococcota bacterium]
MSEGPPRAASDRPSSARSSLRVLGVLLVPVAVALSPLLLLGLGIVIALRPKTLRLLRRDFRFIAALAAIKREVDTLIRDTERRYTVADRWAQTLEQVGPDKPLLVFIDGEGDSPVRSVTYGEMDAASNRVASWARSIGVARGDCVALLMNNQPEYVMIWLGLAKLGVTTALVNPALKGGSLEHAIGLCGAEVLVHGSDLQDSVDSLSTAGSMRIIRVRAPDGAPGASPDEEALDLSRFPADPVDPGARAGVEITDTLFHIFTSGTTGLPKAARIHHLKVVGGGSVFSRFYGVGQVDRIYCCLPLCHSSATIIGLGTTLRVGATLVLRRRFSASRYFADCAEHGATVGMYIGELCRYLCATPPGPHDREHSLRLVLGNGMRPDVWSTFVERFGVPRVGEFYASTEGNANLLNTDNTLGAVGFVSRLIERQYPVKLIAVDPETGEVKRDPQTGLCVLAATDEPGELVGLVDNRDVTRRFDGYTQEADTRRKLITDVSAEGDVYFRTGDLLRKDADGYMYFVDRIGDTFRWKGENVSTTEVAQVLGAIPGVLEANVYGVKLPGHDGRAGMAALTLREGTDPDELDPDELDPGELDPDEFDPDEFDPDEFDPDEFDWDRLARAAHEHLADYAVPVFVRIVSKMKITGTFKHQKVHIRDEGADPSVVSDPLYFMNADTKTYERLTPERYEGIVDRRVRL